MEVFYTWGYLNNSFPKLPLDPFLIEKSYYQNKNKKQICPYRIYQNHCNTCSTLNFIEKVIGKNSSRNNS